MTNQTHAASFRDVENIHGCVAATRNDLSVCYGAGGPAWSFKILSMPALEYYIDGTYKTKPGLFDVEIEATRTLDD